MKSLERDAEAIEQERRDKDIFPCGICGQRFFGQDVSRYDDGSIIC